VFPVGRGAQLTGLPGPLADDYRARLAEPSHREGGGNDIKDEMPYLLRRATGYAGVRVLEIGVRTGRSTSAFLTAAAQVHGHVWSIDAADPDVPARWGTCGYWTFLRARSGDVTPELAGWPLSYDVLFIDGDHSTAGVLGDLRRFVPYVAAGGVVLCHDTKLPGGEVAAALDLFCAEWHQLALGLPWNPGQVAAPPVVTWSEQGGQFGLGVVEAPNG
jgi:predicted O-methyltransferase YrrM